MKNPARKRQAHRRAVVGVVADQTTSDDEAIDAALDELEYLYQGRRMPAAVRKLVGEAERFDPESEEAEYGDEIVNDLISAINDIGSIDYLSFGFHPDDPGTLGWWPDLDGAKEEALAVDDLSEVPRGYSGLVLEVNDHGNATLYSSVRGRRRELWSVV